MAEIAVTLSVTLSFASLGHVFDIVDEKSVTRHGRHKRDASPFYANQNNDIASRIRARGPYGTAPVSRCGAPLGALKQENGNHAITV